MYELISCTSCIGKVCGNIMVSDEAHFLAHLSAPCLKPWGLSCHWPIWTAVKIPKPVFLLGLPTLNKFLWFYWLQGNAPDRCPCKWCQTCTGLIVTSKLSRNSFTWDAGDWQHEPCGHVPGILRWRHLIWGTELKGVSTVRSRQQ